MKILFLVSWYNDKIDNKVDVGGFHYDQAIALRKYCDTAIYYPYDKSLSKEFSEEIEHGILTFRSRKMSGLLQYMRTILDFRKIYKKYKPDIIHAQCAEFAGVIAIIIGKLFKIPVIVTEHRAIQATRFDKWRVKKKIELVYKNSVANICVSDFLTKNLSLVYPKQTFSTIHNGTVVDVGATNTKTYRKDGMVNCCIIGGFYSKDIKGYQYLLPAIKELNETGMFAPPPHVSAYSWWWRMA